MYYFDNAATTKAYDEVAELMNKYLLDDYYNPSALYKAGLNVEKDINSARRIIAGSLGVDDEEIYFTPGGTWGNNIILHSILSKNDKGKVVTSRLEHSSVYESIRTFAKEREIVYLYNDGAGRVDVNGLEAILDEDIALVSIMQVNNELGTIQDIEIIGDMLKEKNILFHVDGVQGYCKYDINLKAIGVDFYTLSGHKIHGPKGIGAMYVNKDININSLNYGGGQEKGLVSGTENVPGIMGLSKAVEIKEENKYKDFEKVKEMHDYLIGELKRIPDSLINSPEDGSIYIINIAFESIKSEVLIHMMSDDGFCISAGSACGTNKKSRILEAIELDGDYAEGPIRISLSSFNTMEECEKLVQSLKKNVESIRKITKR